MAQGKKYNDDVREKAFALLSCNNNTSDVARELGLPYSTVKTWEKKFLARSKELEERAGKEREESITADDEVTKQDEPDLAKLRKAKKEEFVTNAWNVIGKAKTLIERRLDRAIEQEDAIDRALSEVLSCSTMTEAQRKALVNKFANIKVESMRELAIVLGTLYDKQALASKEPTSIVDGGLVKKFEDL